MFKYYLIYFIVIGNVVHGFWFWRRSSPAKPAKCPEVPHTKDKVEAGIKQCQDSVKNKLISEAYALYKTKFEEEHDSKPTFMEEERPSKVEAANLEFESEYDLNKFLEKVKNDNLRDNVTYRPLDIPKDIKHLPLDDSFSKVHDQDSVWGTPPPPKLSWNFAPTTTFSPTLESYGSSSSTWKTSDTSQFSSSSDPSHSSPWSPPPKDPSPSDSSFVQHFNYSPSAKTPSSTTESNVSHDFWASLKKAQRGSLFDFGGQQGPIFEKPKNEPLSIKSKYEEVVLPKDTQQFIDYFMPQNYPALNYPLQENFQEPMKYHNYHSTDLGHFTSRQPKNLFEPDYNSQQYYTSKQIFVPAAQDPKKIFIPQNSQGIFQPTQMEYPSELFSAASKHYPKKVFQPAPSKIVFYPENHLPKENFFMSQDQFHPTSKSKHWSSSSSQPNPAILSIWEDAKRNKKHSRIRRSTKKIYHPNLLTAEAKRLAGCLLNCVYDKNKVLDSNGWPTLEGLLQFYSEGVSDQSFFMTIFRASDICLKSFRSKYGYKEKRQDYGDSCDVAFEVFDCIADQITGYCSEKP